MLTTALSVLKQALPFIIAGVVLMLIYEWRYGSGCSCNQTAAAAPAATDPAASGVQLVATK